MNPFLLPPRDRLANWKQLRESLGQFDEDEQLRKVVNYWAQCPIQKCSVDPEDPASWETPWEMLYHNDFDSNAVAIGMEMTLRLAGWEATRLKLVMINDRENSLNTLVLKIDELKLLNYTYNTVCDIPTDSFDVLYEYQFDGKKYIKTS